MYRVIDLDSNWYGYLVSVLMVDEEIFHCINGSNGSGAVGYFTKDQIQKL